MQQYLMMVDLGFFGGFFVFFLPYLLFIFFFHHLLIYILLSIFSVYFNVLWTFSCVLNKVLLLLLSSA